MITYIENSYANFPKQIDIVQFSSSERHPNMQIDHWYKWVEDQGEVIIKVVCDDGVIMLVRLYD